MSRDFEAVVGDTSTSQNELDKEPFHYIRTIIGDRRLSEAQAQQLRQDLEASYVTFTESGASNTAVSFDLKEEVHQQVMLLKALRKDLFFVNGAPRPDTESAEIKGCLSSSIQLLNILQKFEEALKTDDDVRRIERAVEDAIEVIADHPDSNVAAKFVDAIQSSLERADNGDKD